MLKVSEFCLVGLEGLTTEPGCRPGSVRVVVLVFLIVGTMVPWSPSQNALRI